MNPLNALHKLLGLGGQQQQPVPPRPAQPAPQNRLQVRPPLAQAPANITPPASLQKLQPQPEAEWGDPQHQTLSGLHSPGMSTYQLNDLVNQYDQGHPKRIPQPLNVAPGGNWYPGRK